MKSTKAITWVETLVAICVTGILVAFAGMGLRKALDKGPGCSIAVSHMKQLHLAIMSAAMDDTSVQITNSWPGDTDGLFSGWTTRIVPAYLSANDFSKILSLSVLTTPPDRVPTENTNAVLVYQVREVHGAEVVLLTTSNFTNTPSGGRPPLAESKPYGNKGFIVFRKGGDGAILQSKQAGNTNIIGGFAPLCK